MSAARSFPPTSTLPYANRSAGGRALAKRLREYSSCRDLVVLALPRGGVPVGFEVAAALRAPLDVFVVRKLGVPGQEELAMGAIASYADAPEDKRAIRVLNEDVVQALDIPPHVIDSVTEREQKELERREQIYRGERAPLAIRGKNVILVDDGLATGSTMQAAVRAARLQRPATIIVAVPVAAQETCAMLEPEVDKMVCAATPHPFCAVGLWYDDFSQVSDHEVQHLLSEQEYSE